jgi:hypothetical protein
MCGPGPARGCQWWSSRETASFVEAWHFAVFKSGGYLLLGQTGDHLRTPFTGVFAADGRLAKKIFESEDDDARQEAEGAIRSTLSTA